MDQAVFKAVEVLLFPVFTALQRHVLLIKMK